MERRATEELARETVQAFIDEILGYTNPVCDNNLAAWMMARERAKRLVATLDIVCTAIGARPPVVRTREEVEQQLTVCSPQTDAAFEEMDARLNHVCPTFNPQVAV